jgi:hypothetical protein
MVFAQREGACAWAQDRIREHLREIGDLRDRWSVAFVEAL